jgi:glutamate dehydrogenase/leucine dehydrogenase
MEEHLVTGFKDAYELSKKKNIDMRRACMAIAVKRVVEAFELRGIWP